MTYVIFRDFPGLENGLTKFHDVPWRSMIWWHRGLLVWLGKDFVFYFLSASLYF